MLAIDYQPLVSRLMKRGVSVQVSVSKLNVLFCLSYWYYTVQRQFCRLFITFYY